MDGCKVETLTEFIDRHSYTHAKAAKELGFRHRSSITEKLKYSDTPERFIVITYPCGRIEGANRNIVKGFIE